MRIRSAFAARRFPEVAEFVQYLADTFGCDEIVELSLSAGAFVPRDLTRTVVLSDDFQFRDRLGSAAMATAPVGLLVHSAAEAQHHCPG